MGVAKDLETTKAELAKIKPLIDKSNVTDARKAVDAIEKKIDTIVDNYNKKTNLNMQNLKKVNTAVEELSKILDKTPFEGAKAITAINTATTAVNTAVNTAKTS